MFVKKLNIETIQQIVAILEIFTRMDFTQKEAAVIENYSNRTGTNIINFLM